MTPPPAEGAASVSPLAEVAASDFPSAEEVVSDYPLGEGAVNCFLLAEASGFPPAQREAEVGGRKRSPPEHGSPPVKRRRSNSDASLPKESVPTSFRPVTDSGLASGDLSSQDDDDDNDVVFVEFIPPPSGGGECHSVCDTPLPTASIERPTVPETEALDAAARSALGPGNRLGAAASGSAAPSSSLPPTPSSASGLDAGLSSVMGHERPEAERCALGVRELKKEPYTESRAPEVTEPKKEPEAECSVPDVKQLKAEPEAVRSVPELRELKVEPEAELIVHRSKGTEEVRTRIDGTEERAGSRVWG